MTVVVIVPHRPDHGWRDRLWAHCRQQWDSRPVHTAPGPPGPFNRSAAINAAARQAGQWEAAIIADADVIVPQANIGKAIDIALTTGQLTFPWTTRRNLRNTITKRIIEGWPVTIDPRPANDRSHNPHVALDLPLWPESMTCSSCLVVPRQLWDLVGGFDERFAGWGWDDVAFHRSSVTLAGGQQAVPGDLLHLWHPRAPERNHPDDRFWANKALGQRYKDAHGDAAQIRALLAEPGGPHDRALRARETGVARRDGVTPPGFGTGAYSAHQVDTPVTSEEGT